MNTGSGMKDGKLRSKDLYLYANGMAASIKRIIRKALPEIIQSKDARAALGL